jgi:carbohydrate kinase (thermoresistant glucokinase family)
MVYIVMGVSGSGKTTVGKGLADALGMPFYDADDYHPPSNRRKLQEGIPLGDGDRLPWLEELAGEIRRWDGERGAVLACSALKQKYRDLLSAGSGVRWIYLRGDRETIRKRLQERTSHFASPSILDSQFADLEEPVNALAADIRRSPGEIVNALLQQIRV